MGDELLDAVYVVRGGQSRALEYSLRSLCNLPHGQVWLFGGPPADTVFNTRNVATPQDETKYRNTTRALQLACQHPEVSDPFILMNDDFYIVQPMPAIPPLHRGPVSGVLADYGSRYGRYTTYAKGMEATAQLLAGMGHPAPLSYELHVPMVVDKAAMLRVIAMGEHLPVLHKRTLYGNLAGVGGEYMADVKVAKPGERIPHGPFLSSMSGKAFEYLEPVLRYWLPDPGPYYAPKPEYKRLRVAVAFEGVDYAANSLQPVPLLLRMREAGVIKGRGL